MRLVHNQYKNKDERWVTWCGKYGSLKWILSFIFLNSLQIFIQKWNFEYMQLAGKNESKINETNFKIMFPTFQPDLITWTF